MTVWERVRLGDVTSQVRDAVKPQRGFEYPLLGVKWYAEGPFLRETVNVETSKAATLYRVSAGQFIYNRMFAWKGAFGLVGADLAGSFVSNEFPLFECDPGRLLPEFLALHFCQPWVWDEVGVLSTGTTASRSRWKEALFAEYRVALPSVQEQRRIVDLVAAVDSQIEVLTAERTAALGVLREFLAGAFASVNGGVATIEALCDIVIGGIWGLPEGEGEVDVLALGPRIYSPGTSDFVTAGSPVRSFSRKQMEKRLVREGDIILERSGGSPEQPVGRVVIAGPDIEPCVPTDFQRLLRPDPAQVTPRYLFWRLRHDWADGVTKNFSRRTTGITNLSVKDYLAREVRVPPLSEQESQVAAADVIDEAIRAAAVELDVLRGFRSTLLTSLLSQTISIPESYDALLEHGMEVAS